MRKKRFAHPDARKFIESGGSKSMKHVMKIPIKPALHGTPWEYILERLFSFIASKSQGRNVEEYTPPPAAHQGAAKSGPSAATPPAAHQGAAKSGPSAATPPAARQSAPTTDARQGEEAEFERNVRNIFAPQSAEALGEGRPAQKLYHEMLEEYFHHFVQDMDHEALKRNFNLLAFTQNSFFPIGYAQKADEMLDLIRELPYYFLVRVGGKQKSMSPEFEKASTNVYFFHLTNPYTKEYKSDEYRLSIRPAEVVGTKNTEESREHRLYCWKLFQKDEQGNEVLLAIKSWQPTVLQQGYNKITDTYNAPHKEKLMWKWTQPYVFDKNVNLATKSEAKITTIWYHPIEIF
jgi:hypothetical protein